MTEENVLEASVSPSWREQVGWWAWRTRWAVARLVGIRPPSNLVEHARREYELLGEDRGFVKSQLRVVRAFADFGHSGGSAPVAVAQLETLLRFKPLTPLTDNPADWVEVGHGLWRCRRDSEAFSTDGGRTYYLLSEQEGRRPGEVRRTHVSQPSGVAR